MEDETNIGQRIYDLRVERDVQQGELAEAVHLHQSVLNRIEKGTRPARDREVRDIALFFDVSADELLGLPPRQTDELRLTPIERHLLEKFRFLDRRGQSMVRHTIENEYDFLIDEQADAQEQQKGTPETASLVLSTKCHLARTLARTERQIGRCAQQCGMPVASPARECRAQRGGRGVLPRI